MSLSVSYYGPLLSSIEECSAIQQKELEVLAALPPTPHPHRYKDPTDRLTAWVPWQKLHPLNPTPSCLE